MKVVPDASCILAFSSANRMELLLAILEKHEILLTEQVFHEVKSCNPVELHKLIAKAKRIEADSGNADQQGLHLGEASVINAAKQTAGLAVLDDRRARSVAEKEGINFTGTAALLRKAIEKKLLSHPQAKEAVQDLCTNGKLFLSQEIRDWILETT